MEIIIKGAREHNLKNIDITIPRDRLVVITGVSGSGKSTLAFDIIFTESQRQYLESMSSYARRLLPRLSAPAIDLIEGLSPCIVIDQSPLGRNPRSTVGTVTEIYTFLRLLFSRLGWPILSAGDFSFNNPSGACQNCKGLGMELVADPDLLVDWDKSLSQGALRHRRWKVGSMYWNIMKRTNLFDMDKPIKDYSDEELKLLLYSPAINYENSGEVINFTYEGVFPRLRKRLRDSRGLSEKSEDQRFFSIGKCSECEGSRLNDRARSVTLNGKSIVDVVNLEFGDLLNFLCTVEGQIANAIIPSMTKMLQLLVNLGVGYLTLSRSIDTLSNGESQRIKLARQLGISLTELIYVLDEPTVGLHPRDVENLNHVLKQLRDKPNSVLTVEHDRSIIMNADHIIDMGPGAGSLGGMITAQGSPEEIMRSNSLTGKYLRGELVIKSRTLRRRSKGYLEVRNAKLHNLQNIDVRIPKCTFTCITGVSGSGKSSLIEVLIKRYSHIIEVDQSPIGKTSRGNAATYVGAFTPIREEFARRVGQKASIFSFNSEGACKSCEGLGYHVMNMHFLGDVRQVCEECNGKRFNDEVLKYKYQGKNIDDILDMTATEAQSFFVLPKISRQLNLLVEVGLGYLRLGQTLDTLSGGEAQRLKLADRLSIPGNIYVLDEPTTGLHFDDINRLLSLLNRLVDAENTVIVVEHNLDVIKNADWIIDLGPGGGKDGGKVIAEGTPETVSLVQDSITAEYLRPLINVI